MPCPPPGPPIIPAWMSEEQRQAILRDHRRLLSSRLASYNAEMAPFIVLAIGTLSAAGGFLLAWLFY